jgi:hypothetical protein
VPHQSRAQRLADATFATQAELATALGLARLEESDVFICSYPKSGNTWVRFLLANLLRPDLEISFRNLDEIVPDLHRRRIASKIDALPSPRFIKHHFRQFGGWSAYVYIVRDGRDAMVSYYHYEQQAGRFSGSFSEFLAAKHKFGAWHEHVSAALARSRERPDSFLVLRYENLQLDPVGCTRSLAKFCGIGVDSTVIDRAVARSEVDTLRRLERDHGPETPRSTGSFFRSGRRGEWEEWFGPKELELFHSQAGPVLEQLGYPTQSPP